MSAQANLVYRFADFELQPEERRLLHGGEAVPLTPKVFEILQLLVGRAGHAVSKDDIMAAIWPGRFVAESNLTKHIWTLRHALGEDEEGGRFIETLPKLGYRFLAPVSRTEASCPNPEAPAIPVSPAMAVAIPAQVMEGWRPRFGLLRASAIMASVFAIAALAAWWLWNGREPAFPWSHRAPGTAVAVFDFNNLTHDGRHAWIGPASSEMLGVEIAQGGQVHLLPGELVRQIRSGSAGPDAGGFSPDTLAELRRQLAVDYVVTGSYLASDRGGEPVRLDLALQDARSGATVATFTHTGSAEDLPSLVGKAGADLRRDLNLRPQSTEEQRLAANARPPTSEVAQRIGFALDALHRYDPARARDELLQAVAAAPDYAPAYAYLAQAWSALGYKFKALAAVKQAAAHAGGLPEFMRLKIEAQSYEAQFQWPQAIAALQKLVALQRDDPEAKFDLADAQLAAGKSADAQQTFDSLRKLGEPIASDPRLELLASRIGASRDDQRGQKDHAAEAVRLAEARGNPGQEADAALALGSALRDSDPRTARAMLDKALAIYRHNGNPHGEVAVHRVLGILLGSSQPKRGTAEFQKSLELSESIGDRNGEAAAYQDLATGLWFAGDRDGAETAARDALHIRRETGDIAGQAWALAALAIESSDRRPGDDAIAGLREAAALDAGIGAHAHRAFSLYSLSDLLRLRGQLPQAAEICAQALAEYAKVKLIENIVNADFECALIALDSGDIHAVEASLDRIRKGAAKISDTMTLGNVDQVRGQISMGQANWAGASRLLSNAEKTFSKEELTTGQANALALLAVSDAALGKSQERDAAESRARELRGGINAELEVFQADVSLAELHGLKGDTAQAVAQLDALAANARGRLCPGLALEAELSELHVLLASKQGERAAALRIAIVADAKKYGFNWVIQRATRA